jgi:hypothetical protein
MIRRLAVALAALSACGKSGPAPDVSVAPVTDRIVFSTGSGVSLDRSAETVGIASTIAVPAEQVYAALVAVYRDIKVPLTDANQAQRILGNQSLKIRRSLGGVPMQNYVDCGGQSGQPNAETFDLTLNIMSFVTAGADGGSTLTTRLSGVGSDPNHGQGNQMRCSSTGELEARIAKMVKLQLIK